MQKLGGLATLSQLYGSTDVSSWQTKTPFATIRRIVQTSREFFKIQPGLWALKEYESEILKNFDIKSDGILKDGDFSHAYYQGIIAQIGNIRKFHTFIPAQDKNRKFINQKLGDMASLDKIYSFSYENIVQKAKNIDVIWFNDRKLPNSFFEVEHSTDFKNSLNKFYELQDFNANMFIVADKSRFRQFRSVVETSIYRDIANFVKFADYESIAKQYEKESLKVQMGI